MPLGGFPTLLGAPLAFTPADLRAAAVDVTLVGLTVDDHPASYQGERSLEEIHPVLSRGPPDRARKQAITDLFFVDPRRVDHGVPAP